jgi:hypothetical protein
MEDRIQASEHYPLSECDTDANQPAPPSVPPGLNLGQISEAYLQILGMSPEEAASFAANVDWTTVRDSNPKICRVPAGAGGRVSRTLVSTMSEVQPGMPCCGVKDGLLYVLRRTRERGDCSRNCRFAGINPDRTQLL